MTFKPETQDDLDLVNYQGVLARKAVTSKVLGRNSKLEFVFAVTDDHPKGGYALVTVTFSREDICRYMWRIDAAERDTLKAQKAPGKTRRLEYLKMAGDMFWQSCAEWIEYGQQTEWPQIPFCKSLRGEEVTVIEDQYK